MSVHSTPRTDAAIDAAHAALDAVRPAVQQDIETIVAGLIEAGNIPAARRAVNDAAHAATTAGDVAGVVAAQQQIHAATQSPPAPVPGPAPVAVPAPIVVPVPVAAPAASTSSNIPATKPVWLKEIVDPLTARVGQHHGTLYGEDGESGLVGTVTSHEGRIRNLEARPNVAGGGPNWIVGGSVAAAILVLALFINAFFWRLSLGLVLMFALMIGLGVGLIFAMLAADRRNPGHQPNAAQPQR